MSIVNRANLYSSSEKTKTQYKVSSISVKGCSSKNEFTEVLKTKRTGDLQAINLSTKANQKSVKEFFTENILLVGLYNSKITNLAISAPNVLEAHFLFFDLEHKEGASTKQVSIKEIIDLLEANNLNFIVKTSFSYTEENPRLHVFIPLLHPIKNSEKYTYNWNIFKDTYLAGISQDESVKDIARKIFPSNPSTFKIESVFNKNDYIASELREVERKITEKIKRENITLPLVDKLALERFNEQVKNLHHFIFERYDSNGVIKYRRDNKDTIANVFYTSFITSTEYNDFTIWDKKISYNTLFSYSNFLRVKSANYIRAALQKKVKEAVTVQQPLCL